MKYYKSIYSLLALVLLCQSCTPPQKNNEHKLAKDTLAIHYTVLSVLPHNPESFTQGLTIYNSKILESTGQDNSWIAEVNPGSGSHDKKIILDNRYFGEGITIFNNKLYQLTWKSKVGFIYDAKTYKKIGEFQYDTQGWGITHDTKNLIMSDGSNKLYFLDTTALKIVRTLKVRDGGTDIKQLNELEYIDGYVFANVWETGWILKIDPVTGKVVGRLDLTVIADDIKRSYPEADVLNGIAYDYRSKALLITGKLWPKAYLIRLQ